MQEPTKDVGCGVRHFMNCVIVIQYTGERAVSTSVPINRPMACTDNRFSPPGDSITEALDNSLPSPCLRAQLMQVQEPNGNMPVLNETLEHDNHGSKPKFVDSAPPWLLGSRKPDMETGGKRGNRRGPLRPNLAQQPLDVRYAGALVRQHNRKTLVCR